MRKAEEARLQSKFIDLQLDQSRRSSSVIDDTSLGKNKNKILNSVKKSLLVKSQGFSSTDWLPYQATTNSSSDLISPFISNNTPPSPSQLPLSPYTLFDVPFANLNLSAPSSPVLSETTTLNKQEKKTETKEQEKERVSCKRTFSRTRSTRKPSVKALSKKNRSSRIHPSKEEEEEAKEEKEKITEKKEQEEPGKTPLNHNKVMEALRAKLQRSTQQQKEPKKEEIPSMSPSGILLLDLKNPKRTFPIRAPRTSLVKKPTSFISAHKPK